MVWRKQMCSQQNTGDCNIVRLPKRLDEMMTDLSAETKGIMSVMGNTIKTDSFVHVHDRWYEVLILITGAANKYVGSFED